MTELRCLLPGFIILGLGDYLITLDLDIYQYKYFVLLHFSLIFWSLLIYFSYYFISKRKPSFGGLVITTGLMMKMVSSAIIFYLLHTKIGLSNMQIINFMALYFLYTFLLVYSLSTALNKNMIKNT